MKNTIAGIAISFLSVTAASAASPAYIAQIGPNILPSLADRAVTIENMIMPIERLAAARAIFPETSENIALVEQSGSDNTVSVEQSGSANLGLIVQNGFGNAASLNQNGSHNIGLISQTGYGNIVGLTQSGNNHAAIVTQQGRGNVAIISQR